MWKGIISKAAGLDTIRNPGKDIQVLQFLQLQSTDLVKVQHMLDCGLSGMAVDFVCPHYTQMGLQKGGELQCKYAVQPENTHDFSLNGSCWTEEHSGPTAGGSSMLLLILDAFLRGNMKMVMQDTNAKATQGTKLEGGLWFQEYTLSYWGWWLLVVLGNGPIICVPACKDQAVGLVKQ
ncbi:hypothetical protein HD554DRAFT_2038925 [Boletus coccyginus]|nr:hypothetical protein HD554DRAFT_2038925 [Boletus coccyginus]